ncbi:Hypp6313 [Branchiostoma lanceolatum]|uniref:Hypp6313 protein n=1 Tax=Branchiostoma lanceolatum TaxID=7740 RepID=A0A8J9YSX4_BRALA|nr:Hypp6313 [Branchiostoma lanceolatum]
MHGGNSFDQYEEGQYDVEQASIFQPIPEQAFHIAKPDPPPQSLCESQETANHPASIMQEFHLLIPPSAEPRVKFLPPFR